MYQESEFVSESQTIEYVISPGSGLVLGSVAMVLSIAFITHHMSSY